MLYSTLYRAASVTEFQLSETVVAVDDVVVSPVGAGAAVLDDEPPPESVSVGSVLVALVSMGTVLVAFVDAGDGPSPASPLSGGD